jgi:pimeloyl-ACP methyl ester carboxylesterase
VSAHRDGSELLQLSWQGRPLALEVAWVGPPAGDGPVLVFLHEGLGSVAMWKGFPERFCQALGLRGLVYSRPGYGQSTPRAKDERWGPDFMHRQASEVLPALLQALNIERPWLFGHSDGATIALLHAAMWPGQTAGVVVEAPHVFVEEMCFTGIERAREAYQQGELRQRLARYHADVDSAFYGWCDAWLAPAFRAWSIEEYLPAIRCPVLAMQGEQDEYATLEQIHRIGRHVAGARTLAIPDCGHSPHFDQPEALTREAGQFIITHLPHRIPT